ncbi:MAG: hypothetical protein QM778_17535 [Myxococcales bacterium]
MHKQLTLLVCLAASTGACDPSAEEVKPATVELYFSDLAGQPLKMLAAGMATNSCSPSSPEAYGVGDHRFVTARVRVLPQSQNSVITVQSRGAWRILQNGTPVEEASHVISRGLEDRLWTFEVAAVSLGQGLIQIVQPYDDDVDAGVLMPDVERGTNVAVVSPTWTRFSGVNPVYTVDLCSSAAAGEVITLNATSGSWLGGDAVENAPASTRSVKLTAAPLTCPPELPQGAELEYFADSANLSLVLSGAGGSQRCDAYALDKVVDDVKTVPEIQGTWLPVNDGKAEALVKVSVTLLGLGVSDAGASDAGVSDAGAPASATSTPAAAVSVTLVAEASLVSAELPATTDANGVFTAKISAPATLANVQLPVLIGGRFRKVVDFAGPKP